MPSIQSMIIKLTLIDNSAQSNEKIERYLKRAAINITKALNYTYKLREKNQNTTEKTPLEIGKEFWNK